MVIQSCVRKMIKKEEINVFAKEFIKKCLYENLVKIQNRLEVEEKKIEKDFMQALSKVFEKCVKQQKKQKKRAIKYIHIFYLKSAMLTQKLEYQINVYSRLSYMDEMECSELWYPEFIMDFYKKDLEALDKEAKQKVIKYGYADFREIQERFFSVYTAMVGQYVAGRAEKIVELDSYKKMLKEDDIQIIFGGYMDKGILIWEKEHEKKEKSGDKT